MMMVRIMLVLVSLLMAVGCYGYLAHKQLQDVKDEYLECTDSYYKAIPEDVYEIGLGIGLALIGLGLFVIYERCKKLTYLVYNVLFNHNGWCCNGGITSGASTNQPRTIQGI